MPGRGAGSNQLSNAIMNAFTTAGTNPLTQSKGYADAMSSMATSGKAEADAAKTLMEIEAMNRSKNVSVDDIYQALGGQIDPGLSAEDAMGSDVYDVSQIQPSYDRPDLYRRAKTTRTAYDLGGGAGGNIQNILSALGDEQKMGMMDEMITGKRDAGATANIMAAFQGKDAPVGYDANAVSSIVNKTLGAGSFEKFNNLQRSLIAADPSIATDPKKLGVIADVLSRSDVISVLNNTPGARMALMEVMRTAGFEGVLQYLDKLAGQSAGVQPAPVDNSNPLGL